MSSGGHNSTQQLHGLNKITNTPYRNIKLKPKNLASKNAEITNFIENAGTFEDRCTTLESTANFTNRYQMKIKGMNTVKHNADVQKVRDAILGSINKTHSEYGAYEKRKMRFLNSLDEDKDTFLFKQKKVLILICQYFKIFHY